MNYTQFGFKAHDFDGLMVPIHKIGEQANLYNEVKIFNKYDDFNPSLDAKLSKQKVLRYIVLVFDKASPLKIKYLDPIERRVIAGKIVGFPETNTGKFITFYTSIIQSAITEINRMVITYLFIQNEADFMVLVAYEEALRIQAANLVDKIDEGEKTKDIIANIDSLRKAIEKLKAVFVESKEDTLLERDVFIFTQSKRLRLRPEDYADLFVIGANYPTKGLKNVGNEK